MMGLYVDDVLFGFYDDDKLYHKALRKIQHKNAGPSAKFLGITEHKTEKSVFMSYHRMVNDALRTFNIEHLINVATLMDVSIDYGSLERAELVDINRVQEYMVHFFGSHTSLVQT